MFSKQITKYALALALTLVFANISFGAESAVAVERAGRMGIGMNLSYLDNFWLGTKENNFADFADPNDAAKREKMFADIAQNGFETVRIPINFSAWASLEKPYYWNHPENLKIADNFIKWALDNKLRVIIDLHHAEFDGSVANAATTERIVWLWKQIAARYKSTDPDKVFFEIRNEPHEIAAETWRAQAEAVIAAIRQIAPNHTLIVGFHDWNSRLAMIGSEPFADQNIIYTFHYYDPFLFTHQGATWSSEGLADVKNVPFPPAERFTMVIPESGRGKWVEGLIKNYARDSDAAKMVADLKDAKAWAERHSVPIFLGEFGSFGKFASIEDRCRHARVIYSALGKLNIPNAWWEWDGGFNMFAPGTAKISGCMREAIDSYAEARRK